MSEPTPPPGWRDETDNARINVANTFMRRALNDAHPRPLDVALDLLVPGQFVTRAEAQRLAEGHAVHWKAISAEADKRIENVQRGAVDTRQALAAVAALVDVRRKTVRMDDLRAALGLEQT